MQPATFVRFMLESDDLAFKTFLDLGGEDAEVTIFYRTEPVQRGDADYPKNRGRCHVTDVVQDKDGKSILNELDQDTFLELEAKAAEYHRSRP